MRWLRISPNDFVGRPKVEFPIRFMPASEIPVATDHTDADAVRQGSDGTDASGHAAASAVGHVCSPARLRHPGSPLRGVDAGAHAANEYLVVDDLVTATQVLTLLALEWCGVA